MNNIIPIVTCFNNNYVAPAGVCFYSLLENSNPKYEYKIYVLHNDITNQNKQRLKDTIKKFQNGSIEFINMNNKFQDLFEDLNVKGFYSKEMFYKFCVPGLFPQYEKIIITDVDVCFLGDISKEFMELDLSNDYIAAYKCPIKKGGLAYEYLKHYEKDFTEQERMAIGYAGGYYIYNLEKMRKDNLEEKFINFALKNCKRIIQPEQDTINIICYPNIKHLKVNSLVCTYFYNTYQTKEDFNNDINYSAEELKYALENPIQLHYATHIKPWNNVECTKNEIFFKYLANTPFLNEVLKSLVNNGNKAKKIKVYLLKKIPLIKIKNNKCYLFGFIYIGNIKEIK